MKANELRIGNTITRNGVTVTCDEQTFWDIKNKPQEYEPVKITKEYFDFHEFINYKVKGSNYYYKSDRMIRFGLFNGVVHCSIGDDENGFLYKRLKHVHELQNLYFALTSQELTIK